MTKKKEQTMARVVERNLGICARKLEIYIKGVYRRDNASVAKWWDTEKDLWMASSSSIWPEMYKNLCVILNNWHFSFKVNGAPLKDF